MKNVAWRIALDGDVDLDGIQADVGRVIWSEEDPELLERLARTLGAQPFDLSQQPPARATLARAGGLSELQVTAHESLAEKPPFEDLLRGRAPALVVAAEPVERRPAPKPRRSSLVKLRVAGRPHVHLFHAGGGSGSHAYRALADALPAAWTVTASDDVGVADSIPEMAKLYLDELVAESGAPDVLGGWSMGGLVAFEAVRRLRDGDAPAALLLLDSPPPVAHGADSPPAHAILELALMLWQTLGLGPYRPVELDFGDDDEAAMRALAVALSKAGQTVSVEWLLDRLAEYRRHRGAVSGYACDDRLDVPAVLVAGGLPEPYVEEWRRRLAPDPVVARLPAGHFDLLGAPLVADVAELLVARVEGRGAKIRPCEPPPRST